MTHPKTAEEFVEWVAAHYCYEDWCAETGKKVGDQAPVDADYAAGAVEDRDAIVDMTRALMKQLIVSKASSSDVATQ